MRKFSGVSAGVGHEMPLTQLEGTWGRKIDLSHRRGTIVRLGKIAYSLLHIVEIYTGSEQAYMEPKLDSRFIAIFTAGAYFPPT